MRLLAEGLDMSEIAHDLGVSTHTIRTHMQNLYKKLGFHRRLDVLLFAARHGLVGAGAGKQARAHRSRSQTSLERDASQPQTDRAGDRGDRPRQR